MLIKHRNQQSISLRTLIGMTLLEVMLVLVIAVSILLLGLRQYQVYQAQNNVEQLKYNVDLLFQALAHYYQANCRDRRDNFGRSIPNTGALSPTSVSYPPVSSVPVSWNALRPSFIPANRPFPNPLVEGLTAGYIFQFNPASSMQNITTCWQTSPDQPCQFQNPVPMNAINPAINSNVIIWRAQVAVQLQPQYDPQTYRLLLGADCVSDLADNIVTPCTASNNTGHYLVWERLPSFASPGTASNLWMSIPYLKEFNLQYSHDQMYELSNTPNTAGQTSTIADEYYLCGG